MAEALANSDGGTEKARSKHRSPNYPLFDLGKAVELATKLYGIDKTHKVPIGVVHERWGYKRHSGAGNQAVAALKSYGLVSVDGSRDSRQVAITDAGRRIILNASDRGSLLKSAAVGPSLFNALWSRYSDVGLPSDDVLLHHLIFDRKFNEDFVRNAIDRFKSTVDFAGLTAGDKIEGGEHEDNDVGNANGNDDDSSPPALHDTKRRRPMQAGVKEDVFSLDEGSVVIQWPERLSKASADDLRDWLELIGRKIKRAAESPSTERPEHDGD